MNSNRSLSLAVLFILIAIFPSLAFTSSVNENLELHDLEITENGIFEKTGGDPYIIFPPISQQICSAKGVLFSITFQKKLTKPLLLEVFWSTENLGFGEENKVFFTIFPQKNKDTNTFIVPLDHIATFSQIRIDFPSYLGSSFSLEEYSIVSLDSPPENVEILNAFRVLNMDESLNPHIIVPYFIKSFKHGATRLVQDKAFFVFWIIVTISLLFFIRLFSKSWQNPVK